MFGPRIEAGKNNELVMRDIQPEDLEALPRELSPKVTKYVSGETRRSLAELLVKREKSDKYAWWATGLDRIIWGIFTANGDDERLVGYTGFEGQKVATPQGATNWYVAETGSVLFEPEHMSKGIATATHPCRGAFAFAMGVHCLRSSVIIGNERSAGAVTRAGYALLGTDQPDREGHERYEFRQYHPQSGAVATASALAAASELAICSLDPAAVESSQQYVTGLLQSKPEVVETAKAWMAEYGSRLVYLPTEVPVA